MKIHPQHRPSERASVLMVTLFLTVLFGMFLFYYLNLVRSQNTLVVRAQAWNGSLALAEAGAEEALGQLNPGAPQPSIDRTANGWGAANGGLYGPISRTLAGGSYSVLYTTDNFPIIYATGYVTVPTLSATISRAVCITTTNTPLFTAGMAARFNIDMKGNNVTTDSYNSANTNKSTGGLWDPTKASTNGDIASIAGIVNVGNANVNGKVLLGPVGTDSVSKNGYISGGTAYDFNVDFWDVIVPTNNLWVQAPALATNLTIDTVPYQYAFIGNPLLASTGYYKLSSLSANLYVGANTHITLLINSSSSPGTIRVGGTGVDAGSLTVYMAGTSFTLSGSSAVTVDSGNPLGFTYYGTTNNTSITFGGNSSYVGTIYAPEANFSMGGGGSSDYDFSGACIVNSVTMNGHYKFHFDENLLTAGPVRGYVARSWREL